MSEKCLIMVKYPLPSFLIHSPNTHNTLDRFMSHICEMRVRWRLRVRCRTNGPSLLPFHFSFTHFLFLCRPRAATTPKIAYVMHTRVTSNSQLPDKLNDSPSKMPVFAPSSSVRGGIRCYGGAAIMFMYPSFLPSFLPSYPTDQILQSLHHHRGAEAIQSVSG